MKANGLMTNREFAATDKEFREACERAGIPPSQRQASKWRLKDGKAYRMKYGGTVDNEENQRIAS